MKSTRITLKPTDAALILSEDCSQRILLPHVEDEDAPALPNAELIVAVASRLKDKRFVNSLLRYLDRAIMALDVEKVVLEK